MYQLLYPVRLNGFSIQSDLVASLSGQTRWLLYPVRLEGCSIQPDPVATLLTDPSDVLSRQSQCLLYPDRPSGCSICTYPYRMSVATDPGDLPEVLRATPQPLVGFVGLNPEASAQHRRVWESFTSNRGPDRHAFNFLPLDLDTVELPVAKPARQTYEWLVPRGILKRNWVALLPAARPPPYTSLLRPPSTSPSCPVSWSSSLTWTGPSQTPTVWWRPWPGRSRPSSYC